MHYKTSFHHYPHIILTFDSVMGSEKDENVSTVESSCQEKSNTEFSARPYYCFLSDYHKIIYWRL